MAGLYQYTRPDPGIRAARELARKIEQQQAEAEREALHAQTAIKALHRWNSYQAAYLSHGYLQRKEIQPLGLRQSGAALVNPMYGANGLINLQYIWPNGNKRFMKGAQTAGAYTPIGRLGEVFYICEGYSTGATIHQITGRGVLCALSVSNLLLVARRVGGERHNSTKRGVPAKISSMQNDSTALGKTGEKDTLWINPGIPLSFNGSDQFLAGLFQLVAVDSPLTGAN